MLVPVILLACLCYFLPGLLLHVWLRERGLTLPVCLGLGLAGLILLDVWLASILDYHFPLQFGLNVMVIATLALLAIGSKQWADWLKWLRSQWPWPIVGWGAVTAIFIVPAFVITLPYDTDAQGFALLTATVRLSGSITSLAPFWPEINFFYSPAFFLLAAQLADLLGGVNMPLVMIGLGHMLAVGTVAGVYAVAREFGDARMGAWAAIFSVAGYALFSTVMDSGYTNVLGNFLTSAILVLVFRAVREPGRLNVALAAVALASLPLSHPDSIIHLLMAYMPFFFTIWLAREKPTRGQYLTLIAVIPMIGVALCLPWVIRVLPLAGGIEVHERQNPLWVHWRALFWLNGIAPVALAAIGLLLALRRRRWFDVWLIGWTIMILEISTFGNLDALSRRTTIDPMQIFYPYGVVWHATLIPVPVLAAMAVCALPVKTAGFLKKPATWVVGSLSVIVITIAAGVFSDPIIQFSKGRINITGSLSSKADVQAMQWLRDNTPAEAFILNYPGIEGDWAPVIAERRTVHFREQLFYLGAQPAWALQERMKVAYLDPASLESEKSIREAGVNYVLVPQVIGKPASFASAQRWRPPFIEPLHSSFAAAAYLELVQDFDGAQIWRVKP